MFEIIMEPFQIFLELLEENLAWALAFFFFIGINIGSFLNVCIYRLPDEEKSVVTPRSYCPSCQTTLKWLDLVPLLSYLFLRGKCRYCKAKFSSGYFYSELFIGLAMMGFVYLHGITPQMFFLFYLFISLYVASLIDFKFKIIPDEITFYGMLVGLGFSFFFPIVQGEIDSRLAIADSIIGLLVGGGIIYFLAIVGDLIFKKESMGGGDIKLLAMIGSFIGAKGAVLTLLISPYFAIFFALYYKFGKKEATIPFGPFLSLGALVYLFFQSQINQLFALGV